MCQTGTKMGEYTSLFALIGGCFLLQYISKRSQQYELNAALEASKNKEETRIAHENAEITISYCLRCGWGLRAAYMAQEILKTFEKDIYGVTLAPSMTGGVYKITLKTATQEACIFDRAVESRFPEAKEVKRAVRDVLFPDRALGKCIDKKS